MLRYLFIILFVFVGTVNAQYVNRPHNNTKGYLIDDRATQGLEGTPGSLSYMVDAIQEGQGSAIVGRAVTAILYVSPNGTGTDGQSKTTAYKTIQAALDAASTDTNECTLILIGPHSTYYDIYTAGDPTWAGNYILKGTHRLWAPVRNTIGGATSVMKFTGKISLEDIAIFQTLAVDGVIITSDGYRIRNCGFNSEETNGAATSIFIDGSTTITRGGIIENIQIQGNITYTTGIDINQSKVNEFNHLHIHKALVGIHIEDADSLYNSFYRLDIGECALGIDIDSGAEQHFDNITFHHNTRNVDDEAGGHIWRNIEGQFPIYLYPKDNFAGIVIASDGTAEAWGTLTDIVAADAIDNPFRVVGVHFIPITNQLSKVRFTSVNGAPYYDEVQFLASKREGAAAPSGTEYIFNADTRIEAQASVIGNGPDNIAVWIEIQEF